MPKGKYIITLDEGTTSTRTLIINKKGKIVSSSQKEFTQIFPKSGWVEHDPNEIWAMQETTIKEAKRKAGIKSTDLLALGITNQRETVVMWNKKTGLPVYNAIVWGDSRTADYCNYLKEKGYEKTFKQKTGLIISYIFSGTKMRWILKNVEEAKKALKSGDLLAGTIDSWLIWKLTNGKVHATDVSNASRTMLFNIKTQKWDDELLKILEIPKEILPEVKASGTFYGNVDPKVFSQQAKGLVPIQGVIGDQQSALFGQLGFKRGDIKITYGTSNAALINTGNKIVNSKTGMLATIGWKIKGKPITYALEGNVPSAGSAIQWLRDGLKIIYNSQEADIFASSIDKNDDRQVYFVPALTGLGSPHWDSQARGMLIGIDRGTKREHIARGTLEGICYQTNDFIEGLSKDLKTKINRIKVDGGACRSNFMMQFQSSITNAKVIRPKNIETTAMGAAFMAGLSIGYWKSLDEIKKIEKIDQEFTPKLSKMVVKEKLDGWKNALDRAKNWIK